jgi:hypothetical protein
MLRDDVDFAGSLGAIDEMATASTRAFAPPRLRIRCEAARPCWASGDSTRSPEIGNLRELIDELAGGGETEAGPRPNGS